MRVYITGGGWEHFPAADGYMFKDDDHSLWLWELDKTTTPWTPKRKVAIFPRGGWLCLDPGPTGADMPSRPYGFALQEVPSATPN